MSARICARNAASEILPTASRTAPKPFSGLAPAAASAASCRSNASRKYTDTTRPKSTGSLTFIMVALRCSETIRFFEAASRSSLSMNASRSARDMRAASTVSSASTGTFSLSVVAAPPLAGCSSTRRKPAARITEVFSEP